MENVLGSNIANICLILGVCFLIVALKNPNHACISPCLAKQEIGNLYFGLFIASVVPLTLLYIGYASYFTGVILMAIFVFSVYQLSKVKNVKEEGALGTERERLRRYTLLTFLGAAGVVACAYFIVDSASYIAQAVGIPRVVIGASAC